MVVEVPLEVRDSMIERCGAPHIHEAQRWGLEDATGQASEMGRMEYRSRIEVDAQGTFQTLAQSHVSFQPSKFIIDQSNLVGCVL